MSDQTGILDIPPPRNFMPAGTQAAPFELAPPYRSLVNLLREGFAIGEVLRDGTGRVVNFRFLMQNPAADRLVGVPAIDVVGKLGDQLSPLEYKLWVEVFDRAVNDQLTKTYDYKFIGDPRRWTISVLPFGGDRFAVLYDTPDDETA